MTLFPDESTMKKLMSEAALSSSVAERPVSISEPTSPAPIDISLSSSAIENTGASFVLVTVKARAKSLLNSPSLAVKTTL